MGACLSTDIIDGAEQLSTEQEALDLAESAEKENQEECERERLTLDHMEREFLDAQKKKIAEDKRAATEKRLAEIEIEKLHIDEEKARVTNDQAEMKRVAEAKQKERNKIAAEVKLAEEAVLRRIQINRERPTTKHFILQKQAGSSAMPTLFSRFQDRQFVLFNGSLRIYEKPKIFKNFDTNGNFEKNEIIFPYGENLKGMLCLSDYVVYIDLATDDGGKSLCMEATDILLHYEPADSTTKMSPRDILMGKYN
jgi:hypothetical protein